MAGGAATFRTSDYPLGGGQTVSFTRVTTLIPQHTLKSGSSYEKLLFSLTFPFSPSVCHFAPSSVEG